MNQFALMKLTYPQYPKVPTGPRRTLLALAVFFFLVLVVWLLGIIYVYFHTGAEWGIPPAFAGNTLSLHTPPAKWEQLQPELGEAPDEYLQSEIEAAYLEAWQALNYAYREKDNAIWKDHFAESLWPELDSLLSQQQAFQVEQADLSHHLYLYAFSLDKQLVAFTDKGVLLKKKIAPTTEGEVLYNDLQAADFDVVMTLDDGRWKVRHLRRKTYTPQADGVASIADSVKVRSRQGHFLVGHKPFSPAGINYYPKATPWFDFWQQFDSTVIRQDLALIKELQLNTVRTFVFYELFGGSALQDSMLHKLDTFMDLAAEHDLKVVLTLFDFLPGYAIRYYGSHEKHLRQLLSRYRHHPALLAWDLKNEPDLDFETHGRNTVLDWLAYMAGRARAYDPDHPLTIGWSAAGEATLLKDKLDFISFHYYRTPDSIGIHLSNLRAEIPEKMIMVSEFGLPTYQYWWMPGGHSEEEQARYYQAFLDTVAVHPGTSFISWTLYDFPNLPDNVFGGPFWKTIPQKHYGIIRADGQHKPAAGILSRWDDH